MSQTHPAPAASSEPAAVTPEQVIPQQEPVGTAGIRVEVTEKAARCMSTGASAVLLLAAIGATVSGVVGGVNWIRFANDYNPNTNGVLPNTIALLLAAITLFTCIKVVKPGETRALTFFGRYLGTVRRTGLTATLPFCASYHVPVRVLNFETDVVKANEQGGSPVEASAVVVWQVADTAKATFAVDDYRNFVNIQAESALRHVIAAHPYDNSTEDKTGTLLGDSETVAAELADELATRVTLAGLEIIEVRLSRLAYAPEIAGAMLQRQQAQAVLDARKIIVSGAVEMTKEAIQEIQEDDDYAIDPERKAAMASNLLTVIVSSGHVQPVTNVGTLHA